MHQQHKIFALLAILFFSVAAARADTVTADYDHTVNFGKFKTFMWIHPPEISIPFVGDRVMKSVSEGLRERINSLANPGGWETRSVAENKVGIELRPGFDLLAVGDAFASRSPSEIAELRRSADQLIL